MRELRSPLFRRAPCIAVRAALPTVNFRYSRQFSRLSESHFQNKLDVAVRPRIGNQPSFPTRLFRLFSERFGTTNLQNIMRFSRKLDLLTSWFTANGYPRIQGQYAGKTSPRNHRASGTNLRTCSKALASDPQARNLQYTAGF